MRRLSLIVAEDDYFMREWLVTVLACLDAEVRQAADGFELLALLCGDEPVDLVISDVRMPGQSGLRVLAAARERGIEAPFLFITGYRAPDVEAEAARYDAVVLGKPVAARDLVARVTDMCASAAARDRAACSPAKVGS